MRNKKSWYTIKYVISVLILVSMLSCELIGCSLPYGINSQNNAVSRDEIQSMVDNLLGSIAQDGNDNKSGESESDDLVTETVNVQNDVALGKILSTGEESNEYDENFTILEIVPNPEYAAFGYLIGGLEPLDKYGLDALLNKEIGADVSASESDLFQSTKNAIFGTNNALTDNFIYSAYTPDGDVITGYMEKIPNDARKDKWENNIGGTYALDYEEKEVESEATEDTGEETKKIRIKAVSGKGKFVSEYTGLSGYNNRFYKKDDDNNVIYVEGSNNTIPVVDRDAFCWIWHDADHSDEFDYPKNDDGKNVYKEYSSYEDFVSDFQNRDISEIPVYTRIYYTEEKPINKYRLYNNEMFLLYCLGLNKAAGKNGLFKSDEREIKHEYWTETRTFRSLVDDNLESINEYYGGKTTNIYGTHLASNTLGDMVGKKVQIIAKTPSQVKVKDVDDANLIVITANEGGVYNKTRAIYLAEHDEETSPAAQNSFDFAHGDDLDFLVMREIYEKVVTKKTAIMCSRGAATKDPTQEGGYTNSDFTKNVGRLMLMIYCFYKENTDNNAKEVCSDFFSSFYARRIADSCHNLSVRDAGDGRVIFGLPAEEKNNRPCDRLHVVEPDTNPKYLAPHDDEHFGCLAKVTKVIFKGTDEEGKDVFEYEKEYVESWNKVFDAEYNPSNCIFPQLDGYGDGKDGSRSYLPKLFKDYYDAKCSYRFNNDFNPENTPDVTDNHYMFVNDGTVLMNIGNEAPDVSYVQRIVQSVIKNVDVGTIDFVGANIDDNVVTRIPHEVKDKNGNVTNVVQGFVKQDARYSVGHKYEEEFRYADNSIAKESDRYQYNLVEYEYTEDGKKFKQKVLYLNEYDFEMAKTYGINLYGVIRIQDKYYMANADSSLGNKKGWSMKSGDKRKFRVYDIDAMDKDEKNVQYQKAEVEFTIPKDFFTTPEKLSAGSDDGLFTAQITIQDKNTTTGKIKYSASGVETIRIIARSTFDLD